MKKTVGKYDTPQVLFTLSTVEKSIVEGINNEWTQVSKPIYERLDAFEDFRR
jgi:hypothetical protein